MGNRYTNEDESRKCIAEAVVATGNKKNLALTELCRYKTEAADEFWGEKITNDKYLPYIMMCRSERFSDYAATRLDDYIDRILNDSMTQADAVNEAYFLLHVCMFKESDDLVEVYRKIARNYDTIRRKRIEWSARDIISPYNQPNFLYQRYIIERDAESENTFLNFLTDVIILTAANAVTVDGEDETFTAKIREMCDDYPDAFIPAAVYCHIIKDTSETYDRFSRYLEDPVDYPSVFWVIDGLECDKGKYIQGSPTAFIGPDNTKYHITVPIKNVDIRWYRFLAEKSIEDIGNSAVSDPYYAGCYLNIFSTRLYELINFDDDVSLEICRDYFRKACVIGGNAVDFAGYNDCSKDITDEDVDEIADEIVKRICEGRQRYCFHEFFHFFIKADRKKRIAALKRSAEYLRENDPSEKNASEIEKLSAQAELLADGKESEYDHW